MILLASANPVSGSTELSRGAPGDIPSRIGLRTPRGSLPRCRTVTPLTSQYLF